jgi:hypothetical protein
MVIEDVPAGVVAEVETVSVEVKLGVPDDGEKLAVAPDGKPEAVRPTVEANPPLGEIETVAVVDSPCTTDPEVGLTLMLKSWTGGGDIGEEVVNV